MCLFLIPCFLLVTPIPGRHTHTEWLPLEFCNADWAKKSSAVVLLSDKKYDDIQSFRPYTNNEKTDGRTDRNSK